MSKKIVTHRLSLDLANQKLQATVTLAYGDLATHRLVVDLRHGADVLELPPGSYAIAVQNGVDVLDSVTVYGPDGTYPNCIVYDVSTAVTGVEGVHEARFIISYTDEAGMQMTLTSPKIALVVKEGILKSSDVVLSEPYSAVVQARDAAQRAAEYAEGIAETLEQTTAEGIIGNHNSAEDAHSELFENIRTILSQKLSDGHAIDPTAHSTLFSKKADANKDVLAEIIGDASSADKGLMTAQQAEDLETLVNLLNDKNSGMVDTIEEVLRVFEEWEEEANMVDILAGKLNNEHNTDSNAHSELLAQKVTKSTGTNNVYATDAVGNQTTKKYSSDAEGGAIISRDANGRACVADAISSSDDTTIVNVHTAKLIANNVAMGELGDLRAGVLRNSLRISRLERGLPEAEFETDASIAYSKEVPLDVLPYASIGKIGSTVRKCTNLLMFDIIDLEDYGEVVENGLTFKLNDDGSITVNGTATADTDFYLGEGEYFQNVSFFLSGCPSGGGDGKYCLYSEDASDWSLPSTYDYGSGCHINSSSYAQASIGIRVWEGTKMTNKTFKPMLNLGTSKKSYEQYFYDLRFAPVTSIKSYDGANLLSPPYTLTCDDTEQLEYIDVIDNGDGSITINGQAESTVQFDLTTITLPKGTYILSGFSDEYMWSDFYIETVVDGYSKYYSSGKIFDVPVDTEFRVYFEAEGMGDTFDNVTFTPKLCVVSSDSSVSLVNTIQIPQDVQSLGYGWSIDDTCYNYIDLEAKQLVKRVGCVVMGDLSWSGDVNFYYAQIPNMAPSDGTSAGRRSGFLSNLYTPSTNIDTTNLDNMGMVRHENGGIYLKDTRTNNPTQLKTLLAYTKLYYELAQPEIIDISSIFLAENLITIECGGFITFENDHKYAVFNEVIYQKQEVAE